MNIIRNIKGRFDYYWLITTHKFYVLWYASLLCCRVMRRAIMHDLTKYRNDEMGGFFKHMSAYKNAKYGSESYFKLIETERKTINLHYMRNDHHPEHFICGMKDMNLIQFIELCCDWKASVKKNKNGHILESLKINKRRFNISDDLMQLMKEM